MCDWIPLAHPEAVHVTSHHYGNCYNISQVQPCDRFIKGLHVCILQPQHNVSWCISTKRLSCCYVTCCPDIQPVTEPTNDQFLDCHMTQHRLAVNRCYSNQIVWCCANNSLLTFEQHVPAMIQRGNDAIFELGFLWQTMTNVLLASMNRYEMTFRCYLWMSTDCGSRGLYIN